MINKNSKLARAIIDAARMNRKRWKSADPTVLKGELRWLFESIDGSAPTWKIDAAVELVRVVATSPDSFYVSDGIVNPADTVGMMAASRFGGLSDADKSFGAEMKRWLRVDDTMFLSSILPNLVLFYLKKMDRGTINLDSLLTFAFGWKFNKSDLVSDVSYRFSSLHREKNPQNKNQNRK